MNTSAIILVIDDNILNIKVLVNNLNEQGYTTIVARNGEAGLERAKFAQPNLILLDVMMPGIDGLETCRQLKAAAETKNIPIIFMTALGEVADKVRAFAAGGVDYLTKPVEPEELLARVKTQLTLQQLQRELQTYNQELEQRVVARTAELLQANQELTAEIARRVQYQQEKDRLFALVSQQSEQLRHMTNLLLAQQRAKGGLVELDLADWSKNLLLQLSQREREILQLLIEGKDVAHIAEICNISTKTVYTHRTHLMEKLKVDNIASLIRVATEAGLNQQIR